MNAEATAQNVSTMPAAFNRQGGFAGAWLNWRTTFGFGWLEWCVLAGYAALVGCLVPFHEPWADEAQAWMIARDNSLWQIFRYRLHYEGAPGLWHLCLHVLHALGGGYAAMHWMGAAFAVAGVAVWLRWSPFPLLLRVLVPFTFFFAYQYAVVARGYTMFPALAFGLCALFPYRSKAIWFALLAGLLANISLQGTVHSFVLAALYVWMHFRRRSKSVDVEAEPQAGSARWWLAPAVLYGVLLLVAAFTAAPPPDVTVAGGPGPVSGGLADSVLGRFPGSLPVSENLPVPPPAAVHAARLYRPVPLPFFPPDDWTVRPNPRRHLGDWAGWYARHPLYDHEGRILPPSTAQGLMLTLLELVTLSTAPVSTFKLLACAFLVVLSVWLWSRRSLRLLLPWLINIVVGQALWVSDHHTGLFFLEVLCAIWLGITMSPRVESRRAAERHVPRRLNTAFMLLLTLVCAEQIAWTATSVRREEYGQYDPGQETAAFLQAHSFRHMASFDSTAIDVQPYFAKNPFFNMPHGYWVWATTQNPNGAHPTTIAQRPDLVLFSQDMVNRGFTHNDWAPLSPVTSNLQNRDLGRNTIIQDLLDHGYRETHRFCGERYFRFQPSYKACDLIFEPDPHYVPPPPTDEDDEDSGADETSR